jgi:hypothetical protein
MLRTAQLLPSQGLSTLHFDAGRFPRRRQSATGPPGGYPDRTCTGWQRRASNRVRSRHHATPPELQGILPVFVDFEVAVPHLRPA